MTIDSPVEREGGTEKMRIMEAVGSNGQMILDGDILTISRKGAGLLTAISLGLQGEKQIPVAQITAVELRPAGTFIKGYIRLSINGRDPVGGVSEAIRDENAVMIEKKHVPAFTALRDQLVHMIGGQRQRASAGSNSVASEIEKLASLRDRGLLTDAEFSAEKRRLLA